MNSDNRTTKALVSELRELDATMRVRTPQASRFRELVLALSERAIALEVELASELRDRACGPEDSILDSIDPCVPYDPGSNSPRGGAP